MTNTTSNQPTTPLPEYPEGLVAENPSPMEEFLNESKKSNRTKKFLDHVAVLLHLKHRKPVLIHSPSQHTLPDSEQPLGMEKHLRLPEEKS